MRLFFCILIFVCSSAVIFSQENTLPAAAKINGAFLLDKTTVEQAVKILGEPQETKTKTISIIAVEDWLKDDVKKRKFKVLSFHKFQDIGRVNLTFADEKLVGIAFVIKKKIKAAELSAIYRIRFIPVFNEFGLKASVGEFERATKDIKVSNFPRDYHLVAVSRDRVLAAKIFNDDSLPDGFQSATGASPAEVKVPIRPITGKVNELQILSRTLFK